MFCWQAQGLVGLGRLAVGAVSIWPSREPGGEMGLSGSASGGRAACGATQGCVERGCEFARSNSKEKDEGSESEVSHDSKDKRVDRSRSLFRNPSVYGSLVVQSGKCVGSVGMSIEVVGTVSGTMGGVMEVALFFSLGCRA